MMMKHTGTGIALDEADGPTNSTEERNVRSVSLSCGEAARTYIAQVADQAIVLERDREDALRSIDHLLLALGSCTIGNVRNYMRREGISSQGLDVAVDARFNESGGYYESFEVTLRLGETLSAEERHDVLEVARGCLVHKTLVHLAEIDVAQARQDDKKAT